MSFYNYERSLKLTKPITWISEKNKMKIDKKSKWNTVC